MRVYGKIIKSTVTDDGKREIVLDTVFKGKMVLVSSIPVPPLDTYVNVEYDSPTSSVIRFLGGGDDEADTSQHEESSADATKAPKISGRIRQLHGKLTDVNVTQGPVGLLGSVTVEHAGMSINMLVGKSTEGPIPESDSFVSVSYEDVVVPRVLQIRESTANESGSLSYTPFPSGHWPIRWPRACMNCGETNYELLTGKATVETKNLGSKRLTSNMSIYLQSLSPLTRVKIEYKDLFVETGITLYLCEKCIGFGFSPSEYMSYEIVPYEGTRLMYSFQFDNSQYESYFRDLNPDFIEAQISVKERS